MSYQQQIKMFLQDLEVLSGIPYSEIHHQQLSQAIFRWQKTHHNRDVCLDFLNPTLQLFQRLYNMDFPLTYRENDQNLMTIHFESVPRYKGFNAGEAFFQIGVTTPGTLSLKFAKYDTDGSIYLQSSVIPFEDEQRLVMDPIFLATLRGKDKNTGDTLLRFLILQEITTHEHVVKPTEKVLASKPDIQQPVYPSVNEAVAKQQPFEERHKPLNKTISLPLVHQETSAGLKNSLENSKAASFEVDTIRIKLNFQADVNVNTVGAIHSTQVLQPQQDTHPPKYSDIFSPERGHCHPVEESSSSSTKSDDINDKASHRSIKKSNIHVYKQESKNVNHSTQETGKPSSELLSKDVSEKHLLDDKVSTFDENESYNTTDKTSIEEREQCGR